MSTYSVTPGEPKSRMPDGYYKNEQHRRAMEAPFTPSIKKDVDSDSVRRAREAGGI